MGKRFEIGMARGMRVANWIVVVLALATLGWQLIQAGGHPRAHMMPMIGIMTIQAVRWGLFRQYLEVREDGFLVRLGWRNAVIPWGELLEVRVVGDFLKISGARFSDERVRMPKDTAGLFAAIMSRCPNLSHEGFGVKISMSPAMA